MVPLIKKDKIRGIIQAAYFAGSFGIDPKIVGGNSAISIDLSIYKSIQFTVIFLKNADLLLFIINMSIRYKCSYLKSLKFVIFGGFLRHLFLYRL